MPRYVALLRGVSPLNAKMPELKRAFEAAGFENVRTLLGSGNVVFDARKSAEATLQRKAEQAMQQTLGRWFDTIVRSQEFLQRLLATDPYATFKPITGSKRVVTFLREDGKPKRPLPWEFDGARVLCQIGREVFTVYVPNGKSPVFMSLIERSFGKAITTRTWDTVRKCAAA